MIYLLLFISTAALGWFIYDLTRELLVKLENERQRRRFNNSVQRKSGIRLQSYIEMFR